MSLDTIRMFISGTSEEAGSYWRKKDLDELSAARLPDIIMARNETVLRADAHSLWFRWFIQGICNPLRYVDDDKKSMAHVMSDTIPRIDHLYPDEPEDERRDLAAGIAKHVMAEVLRRRGIKRTFATKIEKYDLVNDAGGKPRCWVCGYLFSQAAIDKFMGLAPGSVLPLPNFVDVFRPRGIFERDIRIEVEHIVPVAGGGGGKNNLALSCGWCNKSKGANSSLYDTDVQARRAEFTLSGVRWHELPNPFWVVRLMAIRARCEHPGGCVETKSTAELFIAPTHHHGSPNPSNLHVYCAKHDPYAVDRFVSRADAEQIWNVRRKGP